MVTQLMTQLAPRLITEANPASAAAAVAWRDDWLGNSLLAWVVALSAGVVGYAVVHVLVRTIRRAILPRAERRNSTALRIAAAALGAVRAWLVLLIALAIAVDSLHLGERAEFWLGLVVFALIGIQLVLCVNRVLVTFLHRTVEPDTPAPVMLAIVAWAGELVVWITFGLALLSNAGVYITAFVASLGVGGIAVALALQNILGDLFASVAIGLDKPFEPGEFIMFGENLGTVESVGVKTTRLVSLSGEELAIGNSQLLSQLTHNYSRMPERRVVFGFSVPYATPREHLREITDRTNAIIQAAELVRFDRGHFIGFGDSGFDFEFVYYMLDSDFSLYLDVQQNINDQIIGVLESLEVSFAVPARAVALGQQAGEIDG